ncbi:biotin--[acetyl-CoA-carboxylase] ligase [Bacteroidota bacterium]
MKSLFSDNKVIYFPSLESTNNYASELIRKDLPEEGTIIFTDHQTKGKGQRGNKWESEENKNLTFSIVIYPDFLSLDYSFLISEITSISIINLIKPMVDEVKIKWPNDIIVKSEKMAGILVENSILHDKISTCIVGIGININQSSFPENAPAATSLGLLTKREYKIRKLLTRFLLFFEKWYMKLKEAQYTLIQEEYYKHFDKLGEYQLFEDENGQFSGKITGVDKKGFLIVEKENKELKKYAFKQINFLDLQK